VVRVERSGLTRGSRRLNAEEVGKNSLQGEINLGPMAGDGGRERLVPTNSHSDQKAKQVQ
jgi:hypothetical protein